VVSIGEGVKQVWPKRAGGKEVPREGLDVACV
jgi:hypothetical protein